jgi:hypothetical protein
MELWNMMASDGASCFAHCFSILFGMLSGPDALPASTKKEINTRQNTTDPSRSHQYHVNS